MDKIIVNCLDEVIYHETLENKLEVYIYKKEGFNKKTAYFVTKYGSNNYEFMPIGKAEMKKFPLGIAHFLEHKLFESNDDENTFLKFEKYGAAVNAYTNHFETAYYFSGSDHFLECLNLLLDFVQTPYLTDENIQKEKGIIEQEIDMTNDQIDYFTYIKSLENTLINNPNKNTTIGDKENIRKITKEDLYECYNTFYHPSNMILVMSGDFDIDEVINEIKKNQSSKKFKKACDIKLPEYKEDEKVLKEYEHVIKNVSTPRISITYKMIYPKATSKDLFKRHLFLSTFFDLKFGATTNFEQYLIDKEIIKSRLNFDFSSFDDVVLFTFDADVINKDEFIKEIDKKLKENKFDEKIFNLSKKAFLASVVRAFDNPSYIARKIYSDIIKYNEFTYYAYDEMKNYSFDEFKAQLDDLKFNNKSILYITANKEK